MEKTTWRFYTNSEEAWSAMLESIAEAHHSVDLEQYILCNDKVGQEFLDLCAKKAREGVKVRILCDEVGSFPLARSNIENIVSSDVELRFFNSLIPWDPNTESLWYFRNHRKLLVVDDVIGFTGGACISEEMRGWRESHVRVEGSVVKEMKEAFNIMWNKEYKKAKFYFKKKQRKNEVSGSQKEFSYITNSPLPRKRFMYHELLSAIKRTEHYLYLTTPYFLPDHRLLRTIKKAVKRGVEVRLIVPLHPNHLIVDIASRTFFYDCLKAGIRIFRYKNMIHSKTMVSDGKWSSIGSLNLDNISLRYNFEANLVSTNKEFSFELEKQFLNDILSTTELTFDEWKKRPLTEKILEMLVWPIRKLL